MSYSPDSPANVGERVIDGQRQPLGYQQITSVSASTALTVPTGATKAIVTCTGQAVRWTDDFGLVGQVTISATVGMPMPVNVPVEFITNLSKLRFFEQVGGAILNISYYA